MNTIYGHTIDTYGHMIAIYIQNVNATWGRMIECMLYYGHISAWFLWSCEDVLIDFLKILTAPLFLHVIPFNQKYEANVFVTSTDMVIYLLCSSIVSLHCKHCTTLISFG